MVLFVLCLVGNDRTLFATKTTTTTYGSVCVSITIYKLPYFSFFQDSIYRASHPSATTHTHTHTSQRPKTDGRQGKLSCIVRRYAERKSIFPLNEKNCSHRNARTCSAVPTMRATSTEKQITQLHVPFTRCLIKRKRVFFRFLFCFNAPQ